MGKFPVDVVDGSPSMLVVDVSMEVVVVGIIEVDVVDSLVVVVEERCGGVVVVGICPSQSPLS